MSSEQAVWSLIGRDLSEDVLEAGFEQCQGPSHRSKSLIQV